MKRIRKAFRRSGSKSSLREWLRDNGGGGITGDMMWFKRAKAEAQPNRSKEKAFRTAQMTAAKKLKKKGPAKKAEAAA